VEIKKPTSKGAGFLVRQWRDSWLESAAFFGLGIGDFGLREGGGLMGQFLYWGLAQAKLKDQRAEERSKGRRHR